MPIPANTPAIVTIPRKAVESRDTTPLIQELTPFISPPLVKWVRGNVRLLFLGYDDDSRALWQVPEVRTFVTETDAAFPYWFFIADLRSDTLLVLASCLCGHNVVGEGRAVLDRGYFDAFLDREFRGMNEIWRRHSLPSVENEMRTAQIVEYFDSRLH